MGKLDNKVVIVTGASRGIGAEIANLFAKEGGKVVCAARTLKEGDHPLEGSLEKTVSDIINSLEINDLKIENYFRIKIGE